MTQLMHVSRAAVLVAAAVVPGSIEQVCAGCT